MIQYLRQILTSQYEASLCMLHRCVAACPPEHWEAKIANGTLRWVAYHTLFFTDYYLSSETAFSLRELHHIGGDEREDEPCIGLSIADTLAYIALCRTAVGNTLGAETEASLQGPSGFSWIKFTRGELHVYNIRHIMHHTGQLSAHLRRVGVAQPRDEQVRWVGSGWRE